MFCVCVLDTKFLYTKSKVILCSVVCSNLKYLIKKNLNSFGQIFDQLYNSNESNANQQAEGTSNRRNQSEASHLGRPTDFNVAQFRILNRDHLLVVVCVLPLLILYHSCIKLDEDTLLRTLFATLVIKHCSVLASEDNSRARACCTNWSRFNCTQSKSNYSYWAIQLTCLKCPALDWH